MSQPLPEPRYLGDGVYASFDGYHIWLHLGAHDNPKLIALEPGVLGALVRYSEGVARAAGVGAAVIVPEKEFCESCQRWLRHDKFYCPLFPECVPRAPVQKWKECVCMVHTCYDAPKLDDKSKAATYTDWP